MTKKAKEKEEPAAESEVAEEPDRRAPSVRLPVKMERAAKLIAEGSTQAGAARDPQIEVSTVTVHLWCKKPEFQARVAALRADATKQAKEKLAESLPDAIDAITKIATQGGTPGVVASQLRAAIFIVTTVMKIAKLPEPEKDPEPDAAEGMTEAEAEDMLED